MRIIGETHIPFLSYRKIALSFSGLIILAGLAYMFFGPGLNLGIDFVGGTQVTVKFREAPDLDRLRRAVSEISGGTPEIQSFDEVEKHEVLIRLENPGGLEGDFTKPILDGLHTEYDQGLEGRFDLNTQGSAELTARLAEADPEGVLGDLESLSEYYRTQAGLVLEYRKKQGMFMTLDEVDDVEGLNPQTVNLIKEISGVGDFALLGAESVGPTVGADLQSKAKLAILFSLIGMLAYIWLRFQLPYGIGAVAALFHDVLITLAALALSHREINLPTIAALLTLVGYSVNDTVVVFDRVRENLRLRRGEDLEKLMDGSINQTLSRTFITSGTTLMVVLSLYLFGGDVINTFAFVLLIGIIVGTYSSIFVASPVALAINKMIVARRRRKRRR
ncbi:MAG: protein translocase subunit SecF [Thermoanaerobaculales bacterium]|nr:protein translocase subunit SecF [Thermoanaerobaculales bacterium]